MDIHPIAFLSHAPKAQQRKEDFIEFHGRAMAECSIFLGE
jgi:hypothetical protein